MSPSQRIDRVFLLHVLNDMGVNGTLEPRIVCAVFARSRGLEAVRAGSFADSLGLGQCTLDRLVLSGQEDDFGVCALGHGLHGFEVADLHGGCGGENVGLEKKRLVQPVLI